ncbi:unnamed protein product [Microthlaspi erraticum]|uniref:Uncharacterized protein n=1 Tax=Microthlaspi erraticum TaxID=1685480 RepID=A0A6D2K8R7_9BRAS|nr:unnamed protein product [Microthlaspi erraticum]
MAMSHLYLSSPRLSVSPRLHSPLLPTQFTLSYSKNTKDFANEAKAPKRFLLCRSIHMESEHSGEEPKRLTFDTLLRKTKHVWENSPQPVKDFPWNRAFENFVQLVLDLAISVVKFLFVPVVAVTSISEMSYCAHERKLALVPFPLVFGVVFAGFLQETAFKISPRLKEAEVPWHLIAMMMVFAVVKLPGPRVEALREILCRVRVWKRYEHLHLRC